MKESGKAARGSVRFEEIGASLLVVPCAFRGRGRSPFTRTSHGQLPASSESVIWPSPWPPPLAVAEGSAKAITASPSSKLVARLAAKAVDDVLDAVDLINGCRGISAARVGHGRGIEDPQDLTRRCSRGIEEPGAVAEEDQVACYCHARVGCE